MKVAVLTAVWKRPQITKHFIWWLRNVELPAGMELSIHVVGSPEDGFTPEMEEKVDEYFQVPNAPLSNKWGAGLALMQKDFDYVLILGSDDFPNAAFFNWVYENANQEHAIGLSDFYVYSSKSKQLCYWPGYTCTRKGEAIGAGRVISKQALQQCGYVIWEEGLNKGLDQSMSNRLKEHGIAIQSMHQLNTPVRLFDLKSATNLGSFRKYAGIFIQPKKFFTKHFTEELFKKLYAL